MADNLTLRTNHNPSIFNKDMLLGGLLGSVVAGPLIGGAIGAAIGGYVGKRTQEQENKNGKPVGEPSFWNKDTLIGGLGGYIVGGIAATIAFGLVAGTSLAAVSAGAVIAPGALAAGVVAAGATLIGSTIVGSYIGGKTGQARMSSELQEAREQNIVNELSKNVSPGVAQAVEYAMANDKTKNWAKHIENERAMAQSQEQQR